MRAVCKTCRSPFTKGVNSKAKNCVPCRQKAREFKANHKARPYRTTVPEKFRLLAGMYVFEAKKHGILPHLRGNYPCVDCGAPAYEYDHRDYGQPLKVDAVCRACNCKRGPGIDGDLAMKCKELGLTSGYAESLIIKRKSDARATP